MKDRFTATLLRGNKVEVPPKWRKAQPVEAMLNGIPFDGAIADRFLRIDADLIAAANVKVGDEVTVTLEPRLVAAPPPKKVKDVLERVRKSCFAHEGVTEKMSWSSPTFRVNDKIFVMYVDNHHGDGVTGVWCNAAPGAQEALVRSNPAAFFKPPYVGPKGWLGIRLDRGLEWPVIESLIAEAYRVTAAKAKRSKPSRRADASQSQESASRRRPRRAS